MRRNVKCQHIEIAKCAEPYLFLGKEHKNVTPVGFLHRELRSIAKCVEPCLCPPTERKNVTPAGFHFLPLMRMTCHQSGMSGVRVCLMHRTQRVLYVAN